MAAQLVPTTRVLVVDDEPLVSDSVMRMLQAYGHAVETAPNAEVALTLYEKNKFDLVIIDYAMPGMKGDSLAEIIKQRDAGQRILMITASAETLRTSSTALAAVDSVVSKPFQFEEFRDAVERIMLRSGSTE